MAKVDNKTVFSYIEKNSRLEAMIRKHKIKGFEIEGIELNVYRGKNVVCSILSQSANLDYKNREVVLKGNTTIAVENKTLRSHRANWQTKDKKFFINGGYELINGNTVKRGKGLITDYLLEEIEFCGQNLKKEA
ncbi:dihydroxyacid dehydratase/phosphogluconate dehydratase [Candidatus Scalindua japonica]|uniref:Dihydroxyacid dehydratase/phosphogluconate dehydratase n=2 Tax=Candidatus Scalindua japonica TaxID=1284222 RepID=A0A286TXK7_9BACT|nr:dihydroxyacid dehydratase/phosphogluconate dehydratase [Candidatus Scalindua japonica]